MSNFAVKSDLERSNPVQIIANKISIESDHVMLNDLGRIIPVKNAQEAIWTVLILLKMFSITIQFFNFENAMQRKIALLKSDA
jgi:hypothetical protein